MNDDRDAYVIVAQHRRTGEIRVIGRSDRNIYWYKDTAEHMISRRLKDEWPGWELHIQRVVSDKYRSPITDINDERITVHKCIAQIKIEVNGETAHLTPSNAQLLVDRLNTLLKGNP